MKKVAIAVIKVYAVYLSPLLVNLFGHACRYEPTCSKYTIESIDKYGTIRGVGMGTRRLLSCNGLSSKNYFDPVK